ncbi:MAG: pyruvate formate lyase family protein [Armatimonadia bacterium]
MASDRIKRLRQIALERQVTAPWTRRMLWGESWRETAGDLWWIRRKGVACRHVLENIPFELGADELLVGRASLAPPGQAEAERLRLADEFMVPQPRVSGQTCHMAVDNAKMVRLGALAVKAEVEQYRRKLDLNVPENLEKDAFYQACLECLEGLMALGRRYAQMAREQAEAEKDAARREELLEIAAVCDRVPAYPARTFHEALQSVHFLTVAMVYGEGPPLFNPCRMDRWLRDFYRADIAAGRLTPQRAQELIDCYYVLMNEYVTPSLAIGVMVGGTDVEGNDVTNEVSYLCLQAIEDVGLAYPSVGICWHEGTPEELLRFGCQVMALGKANPAVFNDRVIGEGLRRAGCDASEACLYTNSTCVEITPVGGSNVWVASPYFNTTGLLLELVDEILAGEVPELPYNDEAAPAWSLDELYTVDKGRLAGQIERAVQEQNTARHARRRFGGFPMQSCFINDCLKRGLDLDWGGARHNWIECSFVGLANLVDSLTVIRELVLERREVTLRELRERLTADFCEYEDFRQRCLREPKYGNDEPEVDALAREFTDFVAEECARYRVLLDDGYYAGFFCWIMHQRLGAETGASPDGRKAGFPFADGAGPAQGRERRGPTGAVKSTTSWDHTPMLGGLVLNLKFSPSAVDSAESQEKLAGLLKTYLRLGGQEAQINVVRREDLLAARENPSEYKDLVVRIAGYCDYFVGLSEQMQEEVIARTEFGEV